MVRRIAALFGLGFIIMMILTSSANGVKIFENRQQLVELRRKPQMAKMPPACSSNVLEVRGGGEDDDDDDADGGIISITKRIIVTLGKATFTTLKVATRSLKAGFLVNEDDVEEEASLFSRVYSTVQRMWVAAFTAPEGNSPSKKKERGNNKANNLSPLRQDEESDDDDDDAMQISNMDFGNYLSSAYKVQDGRDDASEATIVTGGSFDAALQDARNKARLLVVFVPAKPPGKKRGADHQGIESILSSDVSEAVEKRSKKKSSTGSFLLWSTKAGSSEATTAMKRMKVKARKGDKPTLIVAYPVLVASQSGKAKIVPKLLAQHHCSPPPTPESMAAWLNALRKRHAKQYASMQYHLKEAQFYKERQDGYKESIQDDNERQQKEEIAEAERIANEKAEQIRLEHVAERRQEFKNSMPDEPEKGADNVLTIALRFSDGRATQRRFDSSETLATIFNWVDAYYEMERDRITLVTMNGKSSYSWDDTSDKLTLKEAGFGRMIGLRVMEKKEEEIAAGRKSLADDHDESDDADSDDDE